MGFEQLGLPTVLSDMCDHPKGLVLVTGPTGSGNSTTLAAMIDRTMRRLLLASSQASVVASPDSTQIQRLIRARRNWAQESVAMIYQGQERREFFRVHDNLIVEYRIVSEAMTERPITAQIFKSSSTPHLLRELDELAGLCEDVIEPLSERDPDLGSVLNTLNRRLEILTELVIVGKEEEAYIESRPVTLSEGGLSFRNAAELPENTYLALKLIFLPSYQTIRIFARVAQCSMAEPDDTQPHSIGVEFVRLTGLHRATLARYVMQKQLDYRRVMEEDPDEF